MPSEFAVYFWYFLSFGFFGWITEVVYAACIQKKFVNRGFLNGPFCPIYGFGVVLVAFCLKDLREQPILLFLGSTVLTTALEFVTGFVLERFFHTKWWDYSDTKFNLLGYVCLSFSLLWGLACTVVIRIVLPLVDTVFLRIPRQITLTVSVISGVVLLIDFAVTAAALVGLNRQIKALDEVSEKMREISDKLGKLVSSGAIGAEQKIIDLDTRRKELQEKLAELNRQYRNTLAATGIIKRRVLKAFPDLRRKKYAGQQDAFQSALKKFREFTGDMEEKRRKLVLKTYEDHLPKNVERPFGYGLCFNKLFILFVLGCVIGCLLENLWCLAVDHKFELRTGLVYGPFIPVYGLGAVMITLCLYKFYKVRDLWLFLGSMIIGSSVEYFASYFQEKILGTSSWDYSGTPLNIDGRTNLMFGLIWGILGLLWVKDLYPLVSKLIEKIPKKVGNIITIALAAFLIFDAAMSVSAVLRQNQRREGVPASNQFEEYLDRAFPDEYMEMIYPHMRSTETGIENSGVQHLENGDLLLPDGTIQKAK